MLKLLISKEIHESLVSLRFVLTLVLSTTMILLAVWAGAEGYKRSMKVYNATEAMNRSWLEEQPSYALIGDSGMKIGKKPEVLQSLVSGVKDIVGSVVSFNANKEPNLENSKNGTMPLFAVFGVFDLTFIVSVFLSMLAVLYSYNAVTGEKENGTLKLLLANRTSRPVIILGKYLGNLISLLIPVLIPIILGLILLANYPDISLGSEHWMRIFLLGILFLLYVTTFFTLGMLTSSLVSRSSISLVLSLLAWIAFIALIPRASVLLADMVYPLPSQGEVAFQKDAVYRQIVLEVNTNFDRDKFRKEHEGSSNIALQMMEELKKETSKRRDQQFSLIDADYTAKELRQQQFAKSLARFSPTSSLMFGSMHLSLTSPQEYDRFFQSVKNYQADFRKWVSEGTMEEFAARGKKRPKPDLSSMPRYTYTNTDLADSFASTIPDFTVLILINILFFAGAYVAFLRYDVR